MTGAAGMKQTVRLEGGVVRSEAIFHPSTALISKNNGAERGRPGGRRPGAECGEAGARESVGLEANPKLLFSFHPFAFSSTGKAAETGNRYCGGWEVWDVVLNCLGSSDPDVAGSRRPLGRAPAEAQRTPTSDREFPYSPHSTPLHQPPKTPKDISDHRRQTYGQDHNWTMIDVFRDR